MVTSIGIAAVFFGTVAFAQAQQRVPVATDAVTIVEAAQLQAFLQKAPAAKDGKPGDVSTQLFPGGGSCSFIRLNEPDLPHVHPVSEIYVIQSGSGTLETGGTMVGPFTNGGVHNQGPAPVKTATPTSADYGGTALQGGRTQAVKAGDVILVPAGVNHHWTRIDQPIVYLDIKYPKPEARK